MKRPSSKFRGFSLIELMVVMLIIGIVMAFAVPATTHLLRGSQVAQASQIMTDQLNIARQYALTKNRTIEVRLISYADPGTPGEKLTDSTTWKYRAIQIIESIDQFDSNGNPKVDPTGNPVVTNLALDKAGTLPQTIIIDSDPTYSTLIGAPGRTVVNASYTNDPPLPKVTDPNSHSANYNYVAFHFRADGSTDLSPTSLWYLTLHNFTDNPSGGKPPTNYFTIQVDPVTGEVKLYRPGLTETAQ